MRRDHAAYPEAPRALADERRARTPITLLSRRYDQVCTTAVDALQIAATLESDGVTDSLARERYGFHDVFELAAALYHRVPLRVGAHPLETAVEEAHPAWEVARGPLFLLAGAMYPVAFEFGNVWAVTLALALALVAGWSASNALAYLVYRHREEAAAARVLLYGCVVTLTSLVAAAGAASWRLSVPLPLFLTVAALLTFQVAASALLLLKAEAYIAVALGPGALLAVLHLTTHGRLVSATVAAAAIAVSLGLTLAAALGLAWRTCRRHWAAVHIRVAHALGALGSGAYGCLTALLITTDIVLLTQRSEFDLARSFGASVLPLVLTIGAMEPLLRRHRNRARILLHQSFTRRAFAARVRRSFVGVLCIYAGILAATGLVVLPALLNALGGAPRFSELLLGQILLGIAIFVSYAVLGQGASRGVLVALATAAALHVADAAGYLAGLPAHDPQLGYLLACALYLTLLIPVLTTRLGRAEAYR